MNDHGLVLGRAGDDAWILWDSNGSVWAVEERLLWLLPLLERHPDEVVESLRETLVTETPLSDLVRFGLTAWGDYWPGLALGWLEAGWPVSNVIDVLAMMKDAASLPQTLRHRALRIWRRALTK